MSKLKRRLRRVWLDIEALKFALSSMKDDRFAWEQRHGPGPDDPWIAKYEAAETHLAELIAKAEKR